MPGYTDAAKDAALEAIKPDHVSLHTADPGSTGEHELTGGEYERKAIEWNTAADGAMTEKSGVIDIPTPEKVTVKFVGYWKSGVLYASDEVDEESFNNAGVYNLETAELNFNA